MKWPALVSAEQLSGAAFTTAEIKDIVKFSLCEDQHGDEYINYEELARLINQSFLDKLENEPESPMQQRDAEIKLMRKRRFEDCGLKP